MQQAEKMVQSPNAVPQCCFNDRPAFKQYWLNDTCLRKVYNRPGDKLVLGQRRRQLIGIEPAMGCRAGSTLNRNLVGSLHPLYQVHRRQILNEC